MILSSDFRSAIDTLQTLTQSEPPHRNMIFGMQYNMKQHPTIAALKVLMKVSKNGTEDQKKELLQNKDRVKQLNGILKGNDKKISGNANFANMYPSEIRGMHIELPKTKLERMIDAATLIPRIFVTAIIDIVLLPGALILLIAAKLKANFNPTPDQIKKGKTAILMLHGSGFNESEWVIGRQFLKKEGYGSVFSMNYDGLVSNDRKMGIEDYAGGKVRDEIKRIKKITGCDNVILVGHSMGGLIAGYYAEHFAEEDGVRIDHVFSIATPWQGTPTIDAMWKLGGPYSKDKETKRHLQMSLCGGTLADSNFRVNLVNKALQSERSGKRKYYSIWSSTDYAVPKNYGCLTEDPRRQRSFSYLGHYALVAWPLVWTQMRSWLDEAYAIRSQIPVTSMDGYEPKACT